MSFFLIVSIAPLVAGFALATLYAKSALRAFAVVLLGFVVAIGLFFTASFSRTPNGLRPAPIARSSGAGGGSPASSPTGSYGSSASGSRASWPAVSCPSGVARAS